MKDNALSFTYIFLQFQLEWIWIYKLTYKITTNRGLE